MMSPTPNNSNNPPSGSRPSALTAAPSPALVAASSLAAPTQPNNNTNTNASNDALVFNSSTTTGVGSETLQPLQRRLMKVLKENVANSQNSVADVHLVGDDGIAVPALRCILSCTSPVFERMLFGQFSENKLHAHIPIPGVNSTVLKWLVEYCCSDALISFANQLSETDTHVTQQVTHAVLLAELGDKYQIPGLEMAVVKFLKQWMKDDPPLACIVFDLSHRDVTPLIRAASWKLLLSSEQQSALEGITGLSAPRLVELYQHATQIQASPLFLLERLLEWYNHHKEEDDTAATATCRKASTYIQLSAIDPVSLQTIVRRAPFMDPQHILDAFMEQALLAHNLGLDFSHTNYQQGEQPRCRHVLIQGAGIDKINGIYVQDEPPITALIQQQFTKRNESTGEQVFLVQGREDGLWFICDPAQYYYHCKSPVDVLPSTGWSVVSSSQTDISPAPTCKFFFYHNPEAAAALALANTTTGADGAGKQEKKKKGDRKVAPNAAAPTS
ncbi:expressed unknown protein [Seminavis robusta]|uniref:BTB domain-containing protein n=1 Tax=Seminavis robusta TaxID=568900 RepID=A0A9N8DFK0_9STRA|nr:expressed unknown protein [Seminavis robusta]|eukprot:Sro65_g036610.1 n/a (501) ;mRNA; f:27306-28808